MASEQRKTSTLNRTRSLTVHIDVMAFGGGEGWQGNSLTSGLFFWVWFLPFIQRQSNLRGEEAASGTSIPVSCTNLQENYTILKEQERSRRRLQRVDTVHIGAYNVGVCKLQTLECVRWRVQRGKKKFEYISNALYNGKVFFDGIFSFTLTN